MPHIHLTGTSEEIADQTFVNATLEVDGNHQEIVEILAAAMIDTPEFMLMTAEALKMTQEIETHFKNNKN